MGNNYQNKKIDTSELAMPETVSVALGEIAADLREGLLALAVGTGLQVMASMMEADVTALAGPKSRHDPDRTAVRHGHGAGSVTLGGRRVPVVRPRVRSVDGSAELPVPAYELFSGTEILGRMALDRMLAGLSTRRYPVGLEPVGARTEAVASATSKSAVSRRFVAATETAWPSCWPRISPSWIWWRSWSMGCTSVSTPAWLPSGSTSRAPSTRCRWWRALPRTPPWSPT